MSRPTRAKALVQVKVAPELHTALKHFAIDTEQDMSEIGARLFEQYLRAQGAYPRPQSQHAAQSDRLAQSA